MKEQMEVMMNALKGRVSNDLDDLVNRTDSLFTTSVNSFPLPQKFRMPQIENYNGVKDPLDHLKTFKILKHLQGVPDEIMCRTFSTTLKGPARVQKIHRMLMSFKQREDETLRSYITHFNKLALSIDEADDKILVAAFTNGLRKGKFLFSLYRNDLRTMSDVLYRATKYMNALLARKEKPRKRERQEDTRQDRGRKIKDEGALTFPGKLKGDPNKRPRDKYCRFHRDHGHDTANCYDLKQQIEALIRQGKL
ncbi:uncharacterized protein LOC126719861 [Quercus robur]|uniref:uncharacterized protein LOC126719861 n=1 Tax=Quercus robur TaxID=38942 RepID=UPI0021625D12|nr:uncharacterized protein LOC126719861 [Quercus robur]